MLGYKKNLYNSSGGVGRTLLGFDGNGGLFPGGACPGGISGGGVNFPGISGGACGTLPEGGISGDFGIFPGGG